MTPISEDVKDELLTSWDLFSLTFFLQIPSRVPDAPLGVAVAAALAEDHKSDKSQAD